MARVPHARMVLAAGMDAALVVSVVSAVIAAAAVVLTLRQIRLLARQNMSPVVLNAFREARTPEWFEARDYILERLGDEFPPECGIAGLPEEPRMRVRRVGFFYDNLGVLVAHRVVSEDVVLGFFGPGMVQLWDIVAPYFGREGERVGIRYLIFYEHLVSRFRARGPEHVVRRLRLDRLDSVRAAGPTGGR